jgi:hypothetical protein
MEEQTGEYPEISTGRREGEGQTHTKTDRESDSKVDGKMGWPMDR